MPQNLVILVRQNGLGVVEPSDMVFGHQMFDKLLHAVETLPQRPQAICFYTEGVKLVCHGSPVLAALKLIEAMGVRLAVCASCLDYYRLRDQAAAGEVVGMNEILRLLNAADKVISV
jgi:hypothetical protein